MGLFDVKFPKIVGGYVGGYEEIDKIKKTKQDLDIENKEIKGNLILNKSKVKKSVFCEDMIIEGNLNCRFIKVKHMSCTEQKVRGNMGCGFQEVEGYMSCTGQKVKGFMDCSNQEIGERMIIKDMKIGLGINDDVHKKLNAWIKEYCKKEKGKEDLARFVVWVAKNKSLEV